MENITGFMFSVLTLSQSVEQIVGWVGERKNRLVVFANPHSLEVARCDGAFAEAIRGADLVTADGAGVVVASRILAGRIRERVCGPDVFTELNRRLNLEKPGSRAFFLGSSTENLAELERRFRLDYPSLVVAGTFAPDYKVEFSDKDVRAMADCITAVDADIVWIGLGAPKQEKLACRLRRFVNVDAIAPVGGVFDFYTGRIKLPPVWMQRAGLQWLHRFCQQPRRLFRRNLDSPIFILRVLMQRFGANRTYD